MTEKDPGTNRFVDWWARAKPNFVVVIDIGRTCLPPLVELLDLRSRRDDDEPPM